MLCISGANLSEVHLRFTVGRFSFYFFEIHPLLPFLRTIELLFVVITYNYPQSYANYYVQLDNVMRSFFDCVAITATVTSQFREILTSTNKHQGIEGYFCDNVFNIVIVTVSYELPSYYSFIRMGIFATYLDYKYVNAICTVLWKLYPTLC